MKKFIQLLTILTAISAMLSACVAAPVTPETQTVVVTPAAAGNSASLKVGDILEIQIPTIPTEGYEWQAEDLDTTILSAGGHCRVHRRCGPQFGGRDRDHPLYGGRRWQHQSHADLCQHSSQCRSVAVEKYIWDGS